jgi:low affinity Fe/Cu permease
MMSLAGSGTDLLGDWVVDVSYGGIGARGTRKTSAKCRGRQPTSAYGPSWQTCYEIQLLRSIQEKNDCMTNASNQSSNRTPGRDRRAGGPFGAARFESISQKATDFVSGPWGTITLFGILASWAITIPFVGWIRAYETISEFITVASFILLFLIQRSQSKGMLSLQVKLNELLAAAHRASPELINVEDRTESEVQEIHDRFQEIQQRGPGAHSIADVIRREQSAR